MHTKPVPIPLPPVKPRIRSLRHLLGAALATLLAATGLTAIDDWRPATAAGSTHQIDDATLSGENSFAYTGVWNADAGLPTTGWYAGTEHWSAEKDATATISFVGTSAELYGRKHPGHGIYALSVDGGPETLFDGYAQTATNSLLIVNTGELAQGPHTLKLRLTGDKNSAATGISGQVDYALVKTDGSEAAIAWTGLPQPSQLALDGGALELTATSRLFVLRQQRELLQAEAERLSAELATSDALPAAPPIVVGDENQIRPGDIVLRQADLPGTASPEAYAIAVSDRVNVTGEGVQGVFYGTRQLLQNLKAQGRIPTGSVSSSPAVVERSLHIDVGRKYYTKNWLEAQIRDLAYAGLNTLQLHFSENEGFRIASDVHPEVVSAERLTKAEVRELIAIAKQNHIQIVPALDMPGHLTQALIAHPELRLKNAWGADVRGALDITKPEAIVFAKELIDEYAELFAGSKYWHLGADEFVDFDHMSNYPILNDAAKQRFGPTANGFDLLTAFANDMSDYIEAKGFTVRVWNDGMMRGNVVKLNTDVQITWWTNWDPNHAALQTAIDSGYTLVNFNDSMFYYVLGEAAGYIYPTSARIWAKNWHPGVFPDLKTGPQVIPQPYPAYLRGASFAIWSDRPAAQTEAQVAAGVRSPLRAMAERSWNAGSKLSLPRFDAVNQLIARAPGTERPLSESGPVTVLPLAGLSVR
ncbi:beta-N-acetylhexosaminidase [Luethyella okanaganae]|uniref:Glycoside hydrolase family 20 protein n=1 Tax=Luethyella okanaganae TaxID=69372 RepID=A0ABW1VKN0_9MICO